ncbi:V-set and immunoglobulin domain-containing protein 10 [Centropristis striata]|uniref:V-set and immunoglobulin domain-containing protein 10 n=1 Tax=Centropristis striata TaxID=184440 RepID=UPI0027DEDC5E|nr:V-set and immunoglobulin domain-containing protein 10 [Centropristis striata]
MKIVTLLLLCLCATAVVSGGDATETALTAAPGDIALLPCYSAGNVTPTVTTWMKNGREVVRGGEAAPGPPAPAAGQRLTLTRDGSLNINRVTPGDEGTYLCSSTLPGNNTFHARAVLQVASGPDNVSASVGPATALANGTLIVVRGSSVSFNCSGSSYPSQNLTWAFRGASSSNESLASSSGSSLLFTLEEVQPSAQGVYSCSATNPVSNQTVSKSQQLLVYYVPNHHPECVWALAEDPSHVQFSCSWLGAYPEPTLRWGEDEADPAPRWTGHVSAVSESLGVTLNRSLLFDGQTVKCAARHQALGPGKEKSCSFTLKSPYPEGDPLVTALEATSVTLSCSELMSVPTANTTWRRGLQQELIVPGSKYVLTEEPGVFKLTIHNVSKDDEGVYFCRSENPLAVRELEVYLTVKKSATYTGAIIGVFIAVLIVGSAAIVAKTVYSSRHRICLGDGFGPMEDRGDVLSLVESDDEQIFQDTVPRLPPVTNGNHTTLVQIHRIPSSDHEDIETTDTSPQQQEDTVQTEEPADLVTF